MDARMNVLQGAGWMGPPESAEQIAARLRNPQRRLRRFLCLGRATSHSAAQQD
jgi:hypothetical protein